ncbi:DNA gyrase subunit B [Streptomyces sp. SID8378]|nr:DNA gyrase subunit B [Streptomyces sp. SID8378]MYW99026.1 DNA gyrase subunit B [Streptomyces sp. SID8378]PVD10456.1 DNA gyrase subunit B [Streptomyces sp. CS147]
MRKRPGMYVGSTGVYGLHQLVYEVASRSVNEILAGGGGCVDVTLTRDGGIRIADDGPGIPFEATGEARVGDGLETLLTRPETELRRDGRNTVRWSVYGVGPCAATVMSSRLTAEVRRGGVRRVQEYARGVALAPPAAAGPATDTGTTIAFRPDPDIFDTVECSFAVLAGRVREVALLNRGLTLSLNDERPAGGTRSVSFRYPDGAADFVALLDAETERVLPEVIAFEWEDERMAGIAEAALSWRSAREERVRSFANSAPTPEGGTHEDGFRTGVAAALTEHALRHGLLKPDDPGLGADRVGEGLTAVVSVRLDCPEYDGSTRARLGGATVRDGVEQGVREHLGNWLDRHPERAAAVIGRITRATEDPDER